MAVGGDTVRNTLGDNSRGPKEGFGRCLVALLAEYNSDEISRTIYRPIELGPAAFYLNGGLVRIPTPPDASASMLAEHLT